MDAKSMVGMTARGADGEVVGRISGVVMDEETNTATHVIVESEGGEKFEVPVTAIEADEDADFATFHADRSDEEPGDHTEDAVEPEGYAPSEVIDSGPNDTGTEGQFATVPDEEDEQMPPAEVAREDWQDEADTPDSGYPRNDVYVDPETGEAQVDPALKDNETVEDDVEELLEVLSDTELAVASSRDGVIALSGSIESQEDLDALEAEILGLDGVLEVDTTDIEVVG
ncbi:MAG: PRC-barrel domain-containing protein [Rubrobacter sp.]